MNSHFSFCLFPIVRLLILFISVGALVNFATEATGWSETFPGIEVSLLTLTVQFYTPFWRELLMALGLNDVGMISLLMLS